MINKLAMVFGAIALLALLNGCAARITESPRFVDLGNGICQDTETGAMWQMERTGTIKSIEDARQYAANLKLGGYDDWRLPTVDELYNFINLKDDLHAASSCDIRLDGNFWSDEHDGEGMAGAWEIGDQCGPSRKYAEKNKGHVRAIRP
jgi:hypothetical protein